MVMKWLRLPANDAALTASADTVETQIGTGITVPDWAHSIKALRICHTLLALTTDEEVCGYIHLYNDNNTLEPLYFPLPIAQALTGALGIHNGYEPIIMPIEAPVTPNDVVRAACAYDAATTGAHTMTAYVLFSSQSPRFHLHSQTAAIQTESTTSVTAATTPTNISTIAGKTNAILGAWGYVVAAGGITAAQSCTGYVHIKSSSLGWQEQEMPLNIQPSGLSTQITPATKPVMMLHKSIYQDVLPQGVTLEPFLEEFGLPSQAVTVFSFVGYMDGTNTAAPTMRFGLVWKE